MYQKILAPLDGSEHSQRALREVIKICNSCEKDCQVTLLYVDPALPADVYDLLTHTDINIDTVIKRKGEELLADAMREMKDEGIKFKLEVKIGDPAREISIESNYEQYDLIVMGTRGMGQFKELLLGSVSHKVLLSANCPVLIVK